MTGAGVIMIILVPILFQVVMLSIKQAKRHREIEERLTRIEQKLSL
ncbi:MAG: hypothetical protein ABIE70_00300 [bacterium]